METEIRRATEGDIDAVTALAAEWAAEGITHGQTAEDAARLHAALEHYFFVADDKGSVVGYAQGEVQISDESVSAVLALGTPFVEITNMYVAPSKRGGGVGSRLLQAVLDAAEADGIVRALLFTGAKDVMAIVRFYSRHGFDGWGVQMVR